MGDFIRVISIVAVAAVLTGENCISHFRTSGRHNLFGITVLLFIGVVADIFLAAVGTGVNGVAMFRTSRLNRLLIVVMFKNVDVVGNEAVPAI